MDLGSVADWVVAVTAVIAATGGLLQLGSLRRSNLNHLQVERAKLILDVDKEFESKEMLESRVAIRVLRSRAVADARRELRAGANDDEVGKRAAQLFSAYVTQLWTDFREPDPSAPSLSGTEVTERLTDRAGMQYSIVTRILGWMETVGALTERDLLPREDLLDLYDALFIQVGRLFEQHIQDRRTEGPYRNLHHWEKVMMLKDLALARQDKHREIETKARLGNGWRSNLDWKGGGGK